jgi:hypothetical protein
MSLQEFLSGLGVESQTLKKSNHETNAVRASEFEVGGRREFRIYFDDFLEEDGDGAYRMPQQDRQLRVSFPFSAQQVECLPQWMFTSSLFSGSLRFLMYCTMLLSSSASFPSGSGCPSSG